MGNLTRVLVVDDSALARMVISRRISLDPGIEVVGVAFDGIDALEKVKTLKPDVVTLDVEMPRMDGLTTLSRIMAESPTAVVMLSRLTEEDAEVTIKALEAGAVDFFLKPSMVDKGGLSNAIAGLNDKIKMAGRVDISRVVRSLRRGISRYRGAESLLASPARISGPRPQKNVVIIGRSERGGFRRQAEGRAGSGSSRQLSHGCWRSRRCESQSGAGPQRRSAIHRRHHGVSGSQRRISLHRRSIDRNGQ
jgi:two-component system chemotaxis response regulator CheB